MKCNLFKIALIVFFSMGMLSCSWFEDDHYEATYELVSISQKSPNTDFSQYQTFAVAKEMIYITDQGSKREPENEDSKRIRATVIENMETLGYQLLKDDTAKPDLAIDLSYIKTTTTTYYPGCWWGGGYYDYWGWWGGGYYPYYPYYPYTPGYTSSYSAGVLIMEMAGVKGIDEGKKLPIVWQGLVRGILNVRHSHSEQDQAISKCFEIMPPINNK